MGNLEYAEKFDWETRDRAAHLLEAAHLGQNHLIQEARQAAVSKLKDPWHTYRQWTQQARHDSRTREGQPEDVIVEVAKLRRENRKL